MDLRVLEVTESMVMVGNVQLGGRQRAGFALSDKVLIFL